ncbi:hypothetical protein V494_08115 [Pseudogymnoascus sp. VKM F-4513 (FW-928)]|nr:hypothetical protein V494_08115 [Pseudogymnoascus sp. VKM F-4513 (FW-928)]
MTYDSDTPILLGEMEPPTPGTPGRRGTRFGETKSRKGSGCVLGARKDQRRPQAKSSTFYSTAALNVPTPHPHTTRSPASIKANTVKMVVMYNIAGRQIASHWLSIATLSLTFGGAALAMGGKKAEKTSTPPLNAKNNDEEKFIKDFLADIDSSEKKGQKA